MPELFRSVLYGSPKDKEPAFAFVSRIAAVGGIGASEFGRDIGVSFQSILDGSEDGLSELSRLTGCDLDDLASWTPRKFSSSRRVLKGHQFPSRSLLTSVVRGCPVCLRDDALGTSVPSFRAMIYRANWLISHVSICLKHEHPLVPLWQEVKPSVRYDTAFQFSEIAPKILASDFEGETREPTDFDKWLACRLEGTITDKLWLDQYPLHAAASFCRLLGFALLRLERISSINLAEGSEWACYQMGFDVASKGKAAIFVALQKLNQLAEPRQGPKAVFPILYDRLSHDYGDDPDFAPFREILADHLLKTWPLGPGDELMGEPVTDRHLHSVISAAEETGIDPRRLRKMLAAAGLIDETLPDAWAVFSAKQAEAVLTPLVEYMTAKDFAQMHEMTRSQFDLLVQDGILSPALKDAGTKHVWDPRDGRAFLDRLLAGAETLQQAQHGWEHISKTAQRLKLRPSDIVRAIWDGRIHRFARSTQFRGYRAIHVYHDEVAQILGNEAPPAMALELFAKVVGLGNIVFLNRLIRNGHTPATKMRNPKTKALQLYITQEDSEAFHAKFATLRTLAKANGTTWQKLSSTLRNKGIAPFSPDGADYGNIYLEAMTKAALT